MKTKVATKPMSSPGRAEKYPPPLMRFLRSNVGSRSRGRSRSSPMFVLRKKSAAIETQEPTSPKVTCMGQVRVKRSSKQQQQQQPGKRTGAPNKRRCKWVGKNDKNGCFCRRFKVKGLKPRSLKPVWCKWVLFFRGSFRRKSKIRGDSLEKDSKFGDKSESFVRENENEEEEKGEEAAKVFVSPASTPPKNAFLLTRCRSAPYRSSSLASRFWGEEEEEEKEKAEAKTEPESGGEENPTSGRESICRDSDQQPRMDPETEEKLSFFKEFEGPIDKIREKFVKSANIESEEEEEELVTTMRPLILTRCKSEPARTGEKLDPQLSFWKQRRLGFT
ncbi:hypothetical protein AB3S75_031135 [Citrus x aurantiifolia]